MRLDRSHLIDRPEQFEALESPVRQEILDQVQASGPCSIAQIAQGLGRPADALYYHVRRLVEVGLLIEEGPVATGGRPGVAYRTPGRPMRLRYDAADPDRRAGIIRIAGAMLRITAKDFRGAMRSRRARFDGAARNTYAGRMKGWLDDEQLRRVNELVGELTEILNEGSPRLGASLHALTVVITPVPPGRTRRTGKGDST